MLMGLYDSVTVSCPKCGRKWEAQSKGGPCDMAQYTLQNCPEDVLSDVNRHAPFECYSGSYTELDTDANVQLVERAVPFGGCGAVFAVDEERRATMLCPQIPDAQQGIQAFSRLHWREWMKVQE